MIDPRVDNADSARREIAGACRTVRIIVKKRVSHGVERIIGKCPVRYLIVNLLRIHVIDILRVVSTPHARFHAGKLSRLLHNGPDVASIAYAEKFSVWDICAVYKHWISLASSSLLLYGIEILISVCVLFILIIC